MPRLAHIHVGLNDENKPRKGLLAMVFIVVAFDDVLKIKANVYNKINHFRSSRESSWEESSKDQNNLVPRVSRLMRDSGSKVGHYTSLLFQPLAIPTPLGAPLIRVQITTGPCIT